MNPSILLVEDNPVTRRLVRATLAGEGFSVLEAPDGRSALELARRARPALVILDMVLPDRDGASLVPELRALWPEVPLVAMSGFYSLQDEARACEAGFDEVLVKPVEPGRLRELTKVWLPASAPARPSGQRVLVADDDPIQRKLACVRLQALGFSTEAASDGAEALEMARRAPPDAILSDLLMPRMDGFALCRQVRQDPTLAQVVVVLATSSYVEEEDRRLAADVGADAYVIRTPGMEDVLEAVQAALRRPPLSPRAPTPPPESVEREYTERLVRQLERQVTINGGLAQRCARQGAELSILGRVAQALARQEDVMAGLSEVLAQCLDAGGISHGAAYLFEDEPDTVSAPRHPHTAAVPRVVQRVQVGDAGLEVEELEQLLRPGGLFQHVLTSPEPVPIPRLPGSALERLAAGYAVPVVSGGQALGLLLLGSHAGRRDPAEWLTFARTLGGQVGQALSLARAFARLRASEQRARLLLDSTDQGIYGTDRAGRITFINEAGARLLGRRPEELVGQDAHLLFHHTHADGRPYGVAECPLVQAGHTGRGCRVADEVFWRADGSALPVEYSARPLLQDEQVVGKVVAFADVSARRRHEEDLRRMHRLALEVGAAEGVAGALTVVLADLLELVGGTAARAWVPNRAGLELRADLGHEERAQPDPVLEPALTRARQDGQPVWVRGSGPGWWLIVPVLSGSELVAFLEVAGQEACPEDPRLTRLAATAGAKLGPAIRRRQAEEELRASLEQLRQAQKMEAVGRLAGGVAHDFNNLLTAIMGFGELALGRMGPEGPARREVEEINKVAGRAAALTRQLLALSRRKGAGEEAIDPGAVIVDLQHLLERVVGERGALRLCAEPGLGLIGLERSEFEQVLLNLVINARDALEERGTIEVELGPIELQGAPPRPGLALVVRDSGAGMSAHTREHLFEPFFTTKAPGKGTGLGLSTVWGIVQSAHGTIEVESAPGEGTTFTVCFPQPENGLPRRPAPAAPTPRPRRGSEKVLVVDDQPELLELVGWVLEEHGYHVHQAASAEEALAQVDQLGQGLDALVCDVVLPGLSGPTLALQLRRRYPQLAILFVSGYPSASAEVSDELPVGAATLQKPFRPQDLARRLGELFSRGSPPARQD